MPGAKHEQSLGFTAPIEIIQEGSGQDLPPLGRTPTRNEQRRRILAQGSRDVSAPTGFVNEGSFGLSGQWWNGDPFNGGGLIATATDVALPYSATMSGGSNSGTPEPAEVYSLFSVSRSPRRGDGADYCVPHGSLLLGKAHARKEHVTTVLLTAC